MFCLMLALGSYVWIKMLHSFINRWWPENQLDITDIRMDDDFTKTGN